MFKIEKLLNQNKVLDYVYFDVSKNEEYVGRFYVDLKDKTLNYSYPQIPYSLSLSDIVQKTLNEYILEGKEFKCVN